jgi:arylsulfatase A-like enzyme
VSGTAPRGRRRTTLVGLLLAGCSAGEPSPPVVVYDLAAAAAVAEVGGGWEGLVLGTPDAEAHLHKGFLDPLVRPNADVCVSTTRRARLLLRWRNPAPRVALLDLEPEPGLPPQQAEVFLNGRSVTRLAVRPGRHRYRVAFPAELQKPEVNWLRLAFQHGTRSAGPDDPSRAARFYGLWVVEGSSESLAELASEDAPPPVSLRQDGEARVLVQAVPALDYVLRLPEAAELRFTPRLHEAAGSSTALLRVILDSGDGVEREIWRSEAGGDRRAEVALPVPGRPGALVRLGLRVEPAQGERAWGVWSTPRLLGRNGGDPLPPPAPEAVDSGRARRLRASLAGSNVLVVVLDAAGARHFGCYGYPRRTTPEIDRIASEGVVFERAFTPAAYTLMAMGSVWTSRYPDEHHNGAPPSGPLPTDRLTLAQLLSAQGVHTAGFVGNVSAGRAFGLERGFAEFHELYRSPRTGGVSNAEDLRDAVSRWLGSQRGQRFFAYVHFREPHFPYDPPPPFDTRFGPDGPLPRTARVDDRWLEAVNEGKTTPTPEEIDHLVRLYDGNLAFADEQIGRLRRALEAAGLWDRTLVMVTADHGEALLEHGHIGHNQQLYDETLRIPLILKLPREAGLAGIRIDGVTDLLDVAPTVADAMGVLGRGGSDRAFRGDSLLNTALGARSKGATGGISSWDDLKRSVVDQRYKLIHNVTRGDVELYDLETDPGERTDLEDREPLRAAFYRQALARWWLAMRRGPTSPPNPATLTPEQIEHLKALGYIR